MGFPDRNAARAGKLDETEHAQDVWSVELMTNLSVFVVFSQVLAKCSARPNPELGGGLAVAPLSVSQQG